MVTDRRAWVMAVLASSFVACAEEDDEAFELVDQDSPAEEAAVLADEAEIGAIDDDDPAAAAAPACAPYFGTTGKKSAWVYVNASGKLAYKKTAKGDRIMDFSTAGHGGGGVKLPELPVRVTVKPRADGGDDSAAIQAAIDEVSDLPLQNGVRGAVRLDKGTFHVSKTLKIDASGVVLRGRGSGTGASATLVEVTGKSHRFLEVHGSGSAKLVASPKTSITDAYVASGTSTFHVADASGFAVGDAVMVTRPVTQAWIALLGMDKLVRNGKPQTWLEAGTTQRTERTIKKIAGNAITLDIPLSDSIDRAYLDPPAGSLQKYTFTTRIRQVGVEHLRLHAPVRSATSNMGLIDMDVVEDGWVRDLVATNFTNGIGVGKGARRVTIEDTDLLHDPTDYITSAAPADFSVNGQQVLVQRSSSQGGNKIWNAVTHHSARGPNVFLDFASTGRANFAPHQRWASGLLVDRADLERNLALSNLGNSGSGHGWTIGWGVLWNCVAKSTNVQGPPGATNWAIGCVASKSTPGGTPGIPGSPPLPQGTYDSHGVPVIPESLYLAQLCQRLGPEAVANIGY